jgi:hypothetical protein
MPAGRPTEYKSEFCQTAAELCLAGATDQELADSIGVDVSTIYRWKTKHPEFRNAIKDPKKLADHRVERTLYAKALAGDVTSMIFWLKNRKPDEWREKIQQEHTGADGGPLQIISTIPRPPKE